LIEAQWKVGVSQVCSPDDDWSRLFVGGFSPAVTLLPGLARSVGQNALSRLAGSGATLGKRRSQPCNESYRPSSPP
jgi:hypothetical protein